MPSLRVAVVGVGHLGQHHARLLSAIDGVELVGVVDIKQERAAEIAGRHATTAYTDISDVLGKVDAVSIAVPTDAHVDVALPFLERKVAVLVEKPLAASIAEVDRLIAAAEASGALLGAGHTERFNPAVTAGIPLIHDPRFIEVHRLGTFPERSLDIDVIFDLMIHDLDIMLSVMAGDVVSVEAVGVPVLTPRIDICNARLRFESGAIANLTASRISRDKIRKVRFFERDRYVSVDYAAQEAEAWQLDRGSGDRPAIAGGPLPVEKGEPLMRELVDFVDAVRTGRAPTVTGLAGLKALTLADRVAQAVEMVTDVH
jgi:predicted dehydrogenase